MKKLHIGDNTNRLPEILTFSSGGLRIDQDRRAEVKEKLVQRLETDLAAIESLLGFIDASEEGNSDQVLPIIAPRDSRRSFYIG